MDSFKKKIQIAFNLSGYTIKRDLCGLILEKLKPQSNEELEIWIEKLIESVQKQTLDQPNLEEVHIELALKDSLRSGPEETETVLNIISAFEIPKFTYNVERKKFVKDDHSKKSLKLFAEPEDKAMLFRERYTLLLQRISRNQMFSPNILGTITEDSQKLSLRPIESLLSLSTDANAIILGLLTQLTEGKYFLEDPTGIIQLDLTNTSYHTGIFTENCFVLAEGQFNEKILKVKALAFPPAEASKISRIYFGNENTFGGKSETLLKHSQNLHQIEITNENGLIIFIADVWLDQTKVLEKLKIFLQGYNELPPIAIVFMGNFLSAEHGSNHAHLLKVAFDKLADMILENKNLIEKTKIIFVPGKIDPIAPNILPRPPLPNYVTEKLRRKVPNSIFTTNPCRIQYCTQEIIVIREDLFTKICRNTIHYPESGCLEEHFSKTILCQGHLAPFTSNIMPVYWAYDYALSLYPIPDVIVVADQYKPFTTSFMDCKVINPGSFPKNDFAFKVYIPATHEVDDSCIPEDE